MPRKKTFEEVKSLFDAKNYTLLSTEYKNARSKLNYICNKHSGLGVQQIDYFGISQGRGCPACGYERVSKALSKYHRKYFFEDVQKFFEEKMPDYQLLTVKENFIDGHSKIEFICPTHQNVIQRKTFYSLIKKPWCGLCESKNNIERKKQKSMLRFQEAVNAFSQNGYKVLSDLEDYTNCTSKLKCLCPKHGEFLESYAHLQEGKRCPKCSNEVKAQKVRIPFNKVVFDINNEGLKVLSHEDEYKTVLTPLKLECPKHEGKYFYKSYRSIVYAHCGCPWCTESKGERKIRQILDANFVQYETQKRYKDLYRFYGKYLSYDFFLPNYNLLIEYQGEYHDIITNFSSEGHLKDQKERDELKKEYAKKHNIQLLEIWHYDYDNIESILKKEGII